MTPPSANLEPLTSHALSQRRGLSPQSAGEFKVALAGRLERCDLLGRDPKGEVSQGRLQSRSRCEFW